MNKNILLLGDSIIDNRSYVLEGELDASMNNQFCPDEKSTVYEEGESKDDNS